MIEKTEPQKYTKQNERQTIEVCTNNAEYISTFLRRIKLVMPEAKEIHYRTIIYWLETNGYINNMINEEGIRIRYITQTGKEIGRFFS